MPVKRRPPKRSKLYPPVIVALATGVPFEEIPETEEDRIVVIGCAFFDDHIEAGMSVPAFELLGFWRAAREAAAKVIPLRGRRP